MNNYRRKEALAKRKEAAQLAFDREHPSHISNGDEQSFRHKQETAESHGISKGESSYLMTFTKGMPHNEKTGLVNTPDNVQKFIRAIDSGDVRDFRDTPLGSEENVGDNCVVPDWLSVKAQTGNNGRPVGLRAWESQSAGLAFDLEGPDAQAVTMPPAPALGSEELEGEMAEVYTQALLRDIPFHAFSNGVMGLGTGQDPKKDISPDFILKAFDTNLDAVKTVNELTKRLQKLDWFNEKIPLKLNDQEEIRRCDRFCPTPATGYRGITPGDDIGPYISQFLLVGNTGINGNDAERLSRDGLITYGGISVDQRVRTATPGQDYMQTWEEWLDVQNGAAVGALETYLPGNLPEGRRFIYTPRDLATYVHYDALYEAYLNACLILLGNGTPFDPGIPFQASDKVDHQQGFAHFGGPHILSLVTEVATRALKAVRFQKYNVHRRLRPEALAARFFRINELEHMAPDLREMFDNLEACDILKAVEDRNGEAGNYLLPMPFCEGSPMHPAYGAGHATVAGACVTILKAFFDHSHKLEVVPKSELEGEIVEVFNIVKPGITDDKIHSSNLAYVSVEKGQKLDVVPVLDSNNKIASLTVEGELNKLCSNISIGRDWAGVHYFTDYYESILMGEQIALGILEEQKLTFGENFSMTVPLFNGESRRI
ncbi:vanadium-dependent haloperoxidase [Dokdonia ponticola]|uniref:Vanadium-dependent haloperoxidase n=1 Tax=Dokdonia ponticola TaxID=2041041 RepID=A0ABV9HXV7_9FLAO